MAYGGRGAKEYSAFDFRIISCLLFPAPHMTTQKASIGMYTTKKLPNNLTPLNLPLLWYM